MHRITYTFEIDSSIQSRKMDVILVLFQSTEVMFRAINLYYDYM